MLKKGKMLLAAMAMTASCAVVLTSSPSVVYAQDTGKSKQPAQKRSLGQEGSAAKTVARVGETAPAFTLTDTDGKTHNLSDYKGKIVVLEWFNPDCPLIVKHHERHPTFAELHKEFNGRDVVFLAINSNSKGQQGHGKERNAKAKEEWSLPYPILLDEESNVGRLYGAKTTPHMYVINAEGTLVYAGAIDNNPSPRDLGDKNYVRQALNEVLAGKPVSEPETRPYGCSVKYPR